MTGAMRWWFGGFVVAVFLAGTSVGVLVDRLWLLPQDVRGGRIAPGPLRIPEALVGRGATPERVVDANLTRLERRLALTDDQLPQVRAFLEAWQVRLRSLQDTTREQVLEERRVLERQLSAVLTPDQTSRLSAAMDVLLVPAPRGRGAFGPGGRGGRPFGPGGPEGRGRE